MKWNRTVMWIGTATIVGFLVVTMTPITNMTAEALVIPSELKPADAIVVLGSGILGDGTLGYESQQRLLFGLRLYKQGLAPLLIMSGPGRRNVAPEATVRARIGSELGIPESAILEMTDVLTTRDEAQETAALLKPRNPSRVLLVTEALHMRRAKRIFEMAGLSVFAAPSDNYPAIAGNPHDRLKLLINILIHSSGLVYYKIAGYI